MGMFIVFGAPGAYAIYLPGFKFLKIITISIKLLINWENRKDEK